jgi:hypothetical protein
LHAALCPWHCARMIRSAPALLAALLCTACTQFPELDSTIAQDIQRADYPALVPFDQLILPRAADDPPGGTLAGRSTALRARASALQQGVIDDSTRARMKTGVATR